MVSNKLTNRRQTARKPPVCRSGPPVDSILYPPEAVQLKRTPLEKKLPGITSPIVPRTGQCPPPPPQTGMCDLLANTDLTEPYMMVEITPYACWPSLPPEEDVTAEYSATGGTWIDKPSPIQNCLGGSNGEWEAPAEEGTYTLTAIYTSSTGAKCQAQCTITVEEEQMP